MPHNRTTTTADALKDVIGQPDQHTSEPSTYMELHPRPPEGQSRAPPEYTSLQGANQNPEYYNVGLTKRGNGNRLDLTRDQQMSEPASYMEVHSRSLGEPSRASPEHKRLQGTKKNPGYYNVGFNKGNSGNKHEEIYDEIGIAQS